MILIGLWHGGTLNFILWGAWHGVGLFIHNRWSEFFRNRLPAWTQSSRGQIVMNALGVFMTFNYVTLRLAVLHPVHSGDCLAGDVEVIWFGLTCMNNSKPSSPAVLFRISVTSSILVGLSVSYCAYVLFLQTPIISKSRLAIGCILLVVFAIANYLFADHYLEERLVTAFARRPYILSLCFFLPLLFLPLLYTAPDYPVSPLLQPWTDVAVEFDVNPKSQAVSFSKSDIRLNLNGNVLDAESFIPVGIWKSTQDPFRLDPGSSASLHWTDPAPGLVTLIVHSPPATGTLTVYWDESRTTFELSPDSARQIVLIRRFSTPPAISVLLFLAFYILSAWILFLLLTVFGEKIRFSKWLESAMHSAISDFPARSDIGCCDCQASD